MGSHFLTDIDKILENSFKNLRNNNSINMSKTGNLKICLMFQYGNYAFNLMVYIYFNN